MSVAMQGERHVFSRDLIDGMPAPPRRRRRIRNFVGRYRTAQGMTQGDLARLTGLSPVTISRIESGSDTFATIAVRISRALGVSVDRLWADGVGAEPAGCPGCASLESLVEAMAKALRIAQPVVQTSCDSIGRQGRKNGHAFVARHVIARTLARKHHEIEALR